MKHSSRVGGFFRLPVAKRLEHLPPLDHSLLHTGGLTEAHADQLVENLIGRYALPLSVATNFIVDNEECFVPMATEEPSVVAACSNGARLARAAGGFRTKHKEPITSCQIVLEVADRETALRTLEERRGPLLDELRGMDPNLVAHGGGPREVTVSPTQFPGHLTVLLHVATADAMGANAVNTMGEHLLKRLAEETGATPLGAIITNAMSKRLTEITARFPVAALGKGEMDPETACRRFLAMDTFAKSDPMRAVTHNKGIMNGITAVALATGNDTRAVESAAHFHAATSGAYRPLSSWRRVGDHLQGTLSLPLPFGTVGGMTAHHPLSRQILQRFDLSSATRLASIAGAAGLANNFAALWAISTEGIQRGHMRLHKKRTES